MNQYKIQDHIHVYASWAAARASSVKDNRFSVETGQKILNNSKIRELILNPDLLPDNEQEFTKTHKAWRAEIMALAIKEGLHFTHGIAAKLINIYLKSIIICGGFYEHPKARFIHPPIDRVLLKELGNVNFNNKKKFWRAYEKIAWSKFTSEQYENVINEIRIGLGNLPLWHIEKFWKGHQ